MRILIVCSGTTPGKSFKNNQPFIFEQMESLKKLGVVFDLFLIDIDGTGLEQITFSEEFESFPMFTPDGGHLVFASNRNGSHDGNTNLFIAEWIEDSQ